MQQLTLKSKEKEQMDIDVKIIEPRLLFTKKVCAWLNAKLVKIGVTGRCVGKGFYLLPSKNEEVFMRLDTWLHGFLLEFVLYGEDVLHRDRCGDDSIIYGVSEDELVFSSLLRMQGLCVKTHKNGTWTTFISNPLYKKTAEEAEIWLDLNECIGEQQWQK